jgi:hypothetical protein
LHTTPAPPSDLSPLPRLRPTDGATVGCLTKSCTEHFTAQRSLYVPHSGHYMYRTVVIICTAQGSLYVQHSGHYMYRAAVTICTAQWSLYRAAVTRCTAQRSLYVPHSGHYTYRPAVTIRTAQRSLYVPHSGFYMYHQFNIQQLYVLPTHCIYVF